MVAFFSGSAQYFQIYELIKKVSKISDVLYISKWIRILNLFLFNVQIPAFEMYANHAYFMR